MEYDPESSEASKYTFAGSSRQHGSRNTDFILEDVGRGGEMVATKSKVVALLLSIFLGILGIDWLYLSCGNTR